MHETMRFKGTKDYVATDDLKVAVNAAITLQRPLLVKGEPGTGKTVLAIEVAKAIGAPLIEWHVKSTTKAQQGLYDVLDASCFALEVAQQLLTIDRIRIRFEHLRCGQHAPQGVVDLVRHPRAQRRHRRELLGLQQLRLRIAKLPCTHFDTLLQLTIPCANFRFTLFDLVAHSVERLRQAPELIMTRNAQPLAEISASQSRRTACESYSHVRSSFRTRSADVHESL